MVPSRPPTTGWKAAKEALDGLTDRIAGIGLSGQDATLRGAWMKATGRSDPRSCGTTSAPAPNVAEIEARVGFERLVELTGNRALTGFTGANSCWLRKHEPDHYERIAHVMLPKDYVRLRLTGERAIDVADASGTLLLDVARRRWSVEVLNALEVDRAWLPTVLESPDVFGRSRIAACPSPPAPATTRQRAYWGRGRPAGAAVGRDGDLGRGVRRAA